MNFEDLNGEVLTHVDYDEKESEILLTTKSGRKFKIYHMQDCCEGVWIESLEGEWHTPLGQSLEVTEDISCGDIDYGSRTDTKLTFKVHGSTVITKWIGESNGYYSESVNLSEITGR